MSKQEEINQKSELRYQEMLKRLDEMSAFLKREGDKTLKEPSQSSNPSHETPHHFDSKDLDTECPECKAKIQAFKDAIAKAREDEVKKNIKERASYEGVCEGCGIGVKETETECPFCGGKKGHRR